MPTHLPHDTELVVESHRAQWAVRLLTRALATGAVAFGVVIIYGGRERFAGISYEEALGSPGGPTTWGASILLAGTLAFAGTIMAKPRVVGLGMSLASCWSFFFAIAFARAAMEHPDANNTAPIAYFLFSALFAIAAGVHLAKGFRALPLSPYQSVPGMAPVSSRHVLIVGFLLPLCAVSGISILLNTTPPPGSLEALVPRPGVLSWALALSGGALLYMIAVAIQPRHPVSGVLTEQVASVCLGVAATVYAMAAFIYAGWAAALPSGIVLTLGIACIYRWFELQRWVSAAKRTG